MSIMPGELAVGAGGGLEGEGVHPGDLAEQVSRPVLRTRRLPWTSSSGALGWAPVKPGQGRDLLVDLGVVFHRAGAQGIESPGRRSNSSGRGG